MNIEECYEKMGGNYADVINRLRKETLVTKFLVRFPEDPSYGELAESIDKGDTETAFRAAHTLKGVCQNLGLEKLFVSADEATEALRGGDIDKAKLVMPTLSSDYEMIVDTINEFAEGQ